MVQFVYKCLSQMISDLRSLRSQMISDLRSQISDLRSQRLPRGLPGGATGTAGATHPPPLATGGAPTRPGPTSNPSCHVPRGARRIPFCRVQNQTETPKTRGILHSLSFRMCFHIVFDLFGISYDLSRFLIISDDFRTHQMHLNSI